MRRLLLLLVPAAFLVAACEDPPVDENFSNPIPAMTEDGGSVQGRFYRIIVDGQDCIVWSRGVGQGRAGGLSCDWSSR